LVFIVEKQCDDLSQELAAVRQERDDFKVRLEALQLQFEDTSKRLTDASSEINKLRESVTK
jgi:uncharacterized coiled-coil DUF342 family protein